MSTLSLTLLLLVLATLVGVLITNLLQSRRNRSGLREARTDAGESFERAGAPVPEPSFDDRGPRGEPTLEPLAGESGVDAGLEIPLEAPGVTAPQSVAATPAAVPPQGPARAVAGVLSDIADCLVELQLPAPVVADRLVALTQGLRRVGAKPVVFEALAADDGSGDWRPLHGGVMACGAVRAGVLLANRHGPLNAMEFSEFVAEVGRIAEQIGATWRSPDMAPTLERARELDATCIQLDAQIGVNVDCGEPLGTTDLARLAGEQSLVERGNNRYARLGPRSEVLFSVALADVPNRLTLLLDVPRAPVEQEPWGALIACARACASRLQGVLVDDSGRPLSDAALERIGAQLAQRYESLDRAGFAAGSPIALRLFN
jgi:hypothetical protein